MHTPGRWVGRAKALIEADLGLVEQARASAEEGLAHSRRRRRSEIFTVRHARRARAGWSSRSATCRLPASTCASCPDGCSRAGSTTRRSPSGRTRSRRWSPSASSSRRAPTSSSTRRTPSGSEAPGRWPAPRAVAACSAPPRATCLPRRAAFEASLADAAAVPAGAGPHAALPRRRAPAGAAEARGPGGARAGARDLRGAGRPLWAEKARAELRRISGRAPASEELTETERRVAELAAQGRDEQGDRRRALHGRQHRRGAPLARLPQARRPQGRARDAPGHRMSRRPPNARDDCPRSRSRRREGSIEPWGGAGPRSTVGSYRGTRPPKPRVFRVSRSTLDRSLVSWSTSSSGTFRASTSAARPPARKARPGDAGAPHRGHACAIPGLDDRPRRRSLLLPVRGRLERLPSPRRTSARECRSPGSSPPSRCRSPRTARNPAPGRPEWPEAHGDRGNRPGRRARLDRGVPRARRGWSERSRPFR